LPEITRAIRVKGILNRILQLFGNVNAFWQAVRNNAVLPAAAMVCAEWFTTRSSTTGANMYRGIDEAYHSVQRKVVSSLNTQTNQVEKYLTHLEDELNGRKADVITASDATTDLEKELADIQKTLNALRIQMDEAR